MTNHVLGYIEEVQLPELGIHCLAKVDTGACTSSLHATEMEAFEHQGKTFIRFKVQFSNKLNTLNKVCQAEMVSQRTIVSSNGQRNRRFIIKTLAIIGQQSFTIEISLSNRGSMTYPMLIGRKAINGRFLVDVSR